MVLIAGSNQVSWPALRSYIGKSRISMAQRDRLVEVTGYSFGAVSPFGLKQPLRTLADKSIFLPDEVSIGSGVRGTTVIMETAVLRQALGDDIEIVKLAENKS